MELLNYIVSLPAAQYRGAEHWGQSGHMMGFGFGPLGMILVWVFFLVLIVLAGYLLIRLAMSGSKIASEDSGSESALDILDKRYARGEIESEEYREKKEEITGG